MKKLFYVLCLFALSCESAQECAKNEELKKVDQLHEKYRTLWYRNMHTPDEKRYYDSSKKYGTLYWEMRGKKLPTLEEALAPDTIPYIEPEK